MTLTRSSAFASLVSQTTALGRRCGRICAAWGLCSRGRHPGIRARTQWQPETSPLPTAAPKSICSEPTPPTSRPRPVGAERGLYSPSASGSGLDGRWVARVEARNVTRCGGVVEIRVGEPVSRLVVVRAEWEDEVIDLAKTAGSNYLIGGRSEARNRVADLAKRLV